MGYVALAAMVVAAVVSAVASAEQAHSEKQIAKFNARQAERDAAAAEAEAKQEATRIRREGRSLAGRQIAQAASSGLGLSGSVLDILADDATNVELQALDVEREGQIAGIQGREQADIYKYTGQAQSTNTILTGISRSASMIGSAFSYGAGSGMFTGSTGQTTGVGADTLPPKPLPNPKR